jgi:hypothetical protein
MMAGMVSTNDLHNPADLAALDAAQTSAVENHDMLGELLNEIDRLDVRYPNWLSLLSPSDRASLETARSTARQVWVDYPTAS